MIKIAQQEAHAVVGGTVYTWLRTRQINDTQCEYDRYEHITDKYGVDTGKLKWSGTNVLDCSRMAQWTGSSIPSRGW